MAAIARTWHGGGMEGNRKPHEHPSAPYEDAVGADHGHARDHGGRAHDHGDPGHHSQHGDHGHDQGAGRWARLRRRFSHLVTPHSHEARDKVDPAMETSRGGHAAPCGCRWPSSAPTTVVQAAVVALSGSVALLGDTIHNAADALTAVPLGIAFVLGRRAANRRYTYGYGRAEDLAGIAVVLTIAASCALAGYEAVDRLLAPA